VTLELSLIEKKLGSAHHAGLQFKKGPSAQQPLPGRIDFDLTPRNGF